MRAGCCVKLEDVDTETLRGSPSSTFRDDAIMRLFCPTMQRS